MLIVVIFTTKYNNSLSRDHYRTVFEQRELNEPQCSSHVILTLLSHFIHIDVLLFCVHFSLYFMDDKLVF